MPEVMHSLFAWWLSGALVCIVCLSLIAIRHILTDKDEPGSRVILAAVIFLFGIFWVPFVAFLIFSLVKEAAATRKLNRQHRQELDELDERLRKGGIVLFDPEGNFSIEDEE